MKVVACERCGVYEACHNPALYLCNSCGNDIGEFLNNLENEYNQFMKNNKLIYILNKSEEFEIDYILFGFLYNFLKHEFNLNDSLEKLEYCVDILISRLKYAAQYGDEYDSYFELYRYIEDGYKEYLKLENYLKS